MQRNWIGTAEGAEIALRRRRAATATLRRLHHAPGHPVRRHLLVLAPEHPLVRAHHRPTRSAPRCRRLRRAAAAQSDLDAHRRRPRTKTGVFTGALRHQPGQRREDPDLDRRLRPDGLRHRRHHGRARRTTSATSSSPSASTCRSCEVVQPRRRASPAEGRLRRRRARPINSRLPRTACRRGRPRQRMIAWLEANGKGRRARATTACATGSSPASATGASRSRSSTCDGRHAAAGARRRAAGLLLPEVDELPPDRRRRAAAGARRRRLGEVTAARRAARRARETNTMPQWAGSCWYYLRFLDPHNDRGAVVAGDRSATGCRSTCTSAAPSTPCCTCSTPASGTRCSTTAGWCTRRSRSRSSSTRG